MSRHLFRQIDKLKRMVLQLGALVEKAVHQSIVSVQQRDPRLAQTVIDEDRMIDEMEIDIEEECLHTLALHQPVAQDLRYVVAVLKINNDLERIADLAVNIAEQSCLLANEMPLNLVSFDLPDMANQVQAMLSNSLDALVNIDPKQAQAVRKADDQIDRIHRALFEEVEQRISEHPEHAAQLLHVLNVSRQLERIADHAENIAEDVLYTANGEIYRHGHKRVAPEVAG